MQRILHIFHINFKKNSLTYLKVISIVIIFKEDDKTNLIKDLFFKYSMLTVYSGNVLFRKKISSLGKNMDFENKSTQRKNKIQKKCYKSATQSDGHHNKARHDHHCLSHACNFEQPLNQAHFAINQANYVIWSSNQSIRNYFNLFLTCVVIKQLRWWNILFPNFGQGKSVIS